MTADPEITPPLLPDRARPAKASLSARAAETQPDYLPARMVNEFVYCPRLFYYEWVEGVFAASADTVEGSGQHQRVDHKSDALPAPGEASDETVIHARSVQLASETYGVIAKMDLVEGDGQRVSPVDYKKGRPRETPDGPDAWPADRAQIAVQAIILREHGYACDEGVLYYGATKQRVRVPLTETLVAETAAAIRGREDGRRVAGNPAAARRQSEVSALFAGRHLPARRDGRGDAHMARR